MSVNDIGLKTGDVLKFGGVIGATEVLGFMSSGYVHGSIKVENRNVLCVYSLKTGIYHEIITDESGDAEIPTVATDIQGSYLREDRVVDELGLRETEEERRIRDKTGFSIDGYD